MSTNMTTKELESSFIAWIMDGGRSLLSMGQLRYACELLDTFWRKNGYYDADVSFEEGLVFCPELEKVCSAFKKAAVTQKYGGEIDFRALARSVMKPPQREN